MTNGPHQAQRQQLLSAAHAKMQRGQLDEAEREYTSAVALKPEYAEAHYNLGVFYELHRKDMPRALAQYRKYRELGGRDDRVERIVGSTFR